MRKIILPLIITAAAGASAIGINDWLSINGANEATYLRQKELGRRWAWDSLQTEVWAWRFAVGVEAAFDHPRKPVFETGSLADPEGDEIVQRYVRYRDDTFDVRAGHFDKTLGKGLTLRSYEDRDFDVYQRLDGGVADVYVTLGDREWGDVTALWGRNQHDEVNQEQDDRVGGGQITFRPFDFLYLTGSGAQAKVERIGTLEQVLEEHKLYAGGVGGGWRYFDLYGEYATHKSYDSVFGSDVSGHGFYGILTGYLPRSSVTVEYKEYDDLWFPYNNPPPASVDQNMVSGGETAPPGEWGYYVQGTANPVRDVRVRGGYSYADDKVGDVQDKTTELEDYFGKVRYDLPWPVVVEGGYEYIADKLFSNGAIISGDIWRTPSLLVSWTPWDNHSFSGEVEREEKTNYTAGGQLFTSNRGTAGYTYSSWLGLTVSYEDSDERAQELVDPGNPDPQNYIPPTYRYKNNWLWGEVRLTWYHSTFQSHVFTLGYGSRRGGYVCSSGVCVQEAPFSGLKIALESSF